MHFMSCPPWCDAVSDKSIRSPDVIAIGETLVDLISNEEFDVLDESRGFHTFPGGQATNVALNLSLLGGTASIVAGVGDDAFGRYIRHCLETVGVDTSHLATIAGVPTTLVVVSRSSGTPDFTVYRGADARMRPEDMPFDLLAQTSLVHTSAFALSREPSYSAVLQFVERAHQSGCLISLDPNYHPRLWELDEGPVEVLARICPYVFVSKPSLDDCTRLFGPGLPPEAYARRFLDLGVKNVVITMGQSGALLADAGGITYHSARQVEVVDVTGAGDSFWAGMLMALVDGNSMLDAVRMGLAVAAIKIQHVGPLSQKIDRSVLYNRLGLGN